MLDASMLDKPYILAVDDDAQVLRQVTRDLKRHYGATYQVLAEESGARASRCSTSSRRT